MGLTANIVGNIEIIKVIKILLINIVYKCIDININTFIIQFLIQKLYYKGKFCIILHFKIRAFAKHFFF